MTTKYNPRELEAKNIGPIEHIKFVAEPGKITVLRGPNGSGKSTVLNAADRALTGKKGKVGSLTSRDGTTNGQFDFGGVRIKVARGGTNRAAGELEILSVESDLNIADFVDPGLKSEDAADAKRTKALIVLTGAKADESLFYDLFEGGKDAFLEIVPPEARETDDLLEMAGQVKRAIEGHARTIEKQAENVSSEAQALRDLISEINMDAESDADMLESRTEAGRDQLAEVRERKRWFDENRETYQRAKESLDSSPEDPAEIESEIAAIRDEIAGYDAQIVKLEDSLRKAKHERELSQKSLDGVVKSLEQAQKSAAQRESLSALVDKFESQLEPSDSEILQAVDALEAAKAARDAGVKIREAKEKSAKIDEYEARKKELERRAEDLRSAAKGTEDVLAEVVKKSCPSLKVDEQFRLIANHPKRGECYFSELSEGERWKIGIEIAIEAFKKVNKPGLLIIPQAAFEGLDGKNRKIVLDTIKGTDLAVLTAEATKDETEQKELFADVIE